MEPEVPPGRPVDPPGPISSTLAKNPPPRGKLWAQARIRSAQAAAQEGKEEEEEEDEEEAGNGPPPPPAGGPGQPPGGGNGDPPSESDDDMEEDDEDDLTEDPEQARTGKFYVPQTPNGKAMAMMFRRFCDLAKWDANAIVVYFGIYSAPCLAAFQEDHWKDTFAQWQKRHPNRDGTERAMAIPDLTDIAKWKDHGSTSMLKHFRDFETYLSQHYGVEGFPLDWVVCPKIQPVFWSEVSTLNTEQRGMKLNFFVFEESNHRCPTMAPIVSWEDGIHLKSSDPKVHAEWESESRSHRRSDVFRRDNAIVFQLARIAFADSPGEVHFIPKKGKVQQSGHQSYFACKRQFLGINTSRHECDLARDVIQKMHYEGESQSWNWDKHCIKFHQQLGVIDEWAVAGLATAMSAKDQISASLKTIPKDCKNGKLLIAKGIIEGDQSGFPTLVGSNMIPHLTLSIDTKEPGVLAAKRTIANTSSASGKSPDKCRHTGQASGRGSRGQTTGKCHVVGGKVVGTVEGLHYTDEIWKAMSKEQKAKVAELRQARSNERAVKAASTAPADVLLIPAEIVDAVQRTVIRVPFDAEPGRGAQAVPMALISWEHMQGTVSVDGPDRPLGRSVLTPVGRSPWGLVFMLMLVSFPPCWSHAVVCVLCAVGKNALVIHEHPNIVMVSGFDPSQPPRQAKVVDAAIWYTCRDTGDHLILMINQAIYVPEVDHCLLCPMQCRINGVEINEVPRFLTQDPTTSTHSICLPDPTDAVHPYIIPLQLEGVVSYFEYSLPTSAKFEDPAIPHLELTAESLAWNPYDKDFATLKESYLDYRGRLISVERSDGPRGVTGMGLHLADAACGEEPHWKLSPVSLQYDAADITDDDNFGAALEATQQVTLVRTNLTPETYDICRVHTVRDRGRGLCHPGTSLADPTAQGQEHGATDHTAWHENCPASDSIQAFPYQRKDASLSMPCYPMTCKSDAHEALDLLFSGRCSPKMIVDGAKEMKMGEFAWKCKEAHCCLRSTEPYSPWSNSAEHEIRELKKGAAWKLTRSGAPQWLWCFALEYKSYVRSHTVHGIYRLDGPVPETIVSGETANISPFCEFGFWDWVKFQDQGVAFPGDALVLGKYLGPSIDVGPAMTSRVMKANGEIEDRSTVRALTAEDRVSAALFREQQQFLASVEGRWGPKTTIKDLGPDILNLSPDPDNFDPWEDEDGPLFPELDDDLAVAEAAGDFLVNSEVLLPVGNSQELARVLRWKRDADGKVVGTAHHNPALDTHVYEVRFPDSRAEELAANVIAEAVYAQCDADGNQYVLLDAIVDYRKDPFVAVARDDQVTIIDGKKIIKRSTCGWELCCEWKDSSTSWLKLLDLKDSHPLQVAGFACAAQIANEPAFNSWVSWVLKKRDRIISLVKHRSAWYHKHTHKYGLEIPKSVEEAYTIDKATGTTFWCDFIRCHMIFDVKMEDFRRKARLVAGGHATKAPATLTYASIVSRETVQIALLVAVLNDVDVWAADVLNAYITVPCREKIWTTLGKEFGDDCGKKAIVVWALYGLKLSGAALEGTWQDACTRRVTSRAPQTLTCGSRNRQTERDTPDSVGPPEMYLGAKLRKRTFKDGTTAWGLSPAKYVQQAARNVKTYLKSNLEGRYSLPKRGENPFPADYAPEEDVTPLVEPEVATYYMQLIGILRWMCELGRINICTEVSMLSSYSAMLREGHLEAAFHVFSYLKSKSNSRLIFDPMEPAVGGSNFGECDWSDFYLGASEALPPNAPKPLGKGVTLHMFVDSDHAGDKVSRRSRTGFVIFLNYGMIDWLSKKQSTVETSVFGAEFCAMEHGIENLRGICYKLRMMGVPVKGASYVYGDNMSVVTNTSKPESTLKKKLNSICYHAVHEAVAMGEALVAHIPTKKNLADLFTKVLYGQTRRFIVSRMLWDVFPGQDVPASLGGSLDRTKESTRTKENTELDGFPEEEKFLYGSHYSSPGVVLHYMVRQEPFTSMHIALQSGRFDCPDRLFFDVGGCWRSCLSSTSDVKELIPEFFTCPEIFLNTNAFPLGETQNKTPVDNVILPPWAKGSPYEFIRIHRLALESEYVSSNLHHWIDLIFGYKQRGPAAAIAHNIFHYLSYEGAVDIDRITDDVQRKAIEGHIQNFGQTPSQLIVKEPHPTRSHAEQVLDGLFSEVKSVLAGLHGHDQNVPGFAVSSQLQGGSMRQYYIGESSFALAKGGNDKADEPGSSISDTSFFLMSIGYYDNSVRVHSMDSLQLHNTINGVHRGQITCIQVSSDGTIVVTGGEDGTCIVWVVDYKDFVTAIADGFVQPGDEKSGEDFLTCCHVLLGHTTPVTCLSISAKLDVVVSGSRDGSICLHNIRSGRFIRSLHINAVSLRVENLCAGNAIPVLKLAIHSDGIFVAHLCDGSLYLITVNGHQLCSTNAGETLNSMILCPQSETLITGGEKGLARLWKLRDLSEKCTVDVSSTVK
ncbi:hypothetical protein HJC23_011021 [Cyclotella cryptica]|uniref:BEACH domain-containing protein n=1 Tax=Cyclotella cryptica TaxID=29204 RepID=A0ABD3PED7_9STRA